jgi:hypothetical protein
MYKLTEEFSATFGKYWNVEKGSMLIAGVPIVNPLIVVVWEVTSGLGSNPQETSDMTTL